MNWRDGFVLEVQDGMQSPENGHAFARPEFENEVYGLRGLREFILRQKN